MGSSWTIDKLDPKKLFEVVPNADPETSSRFSLPIPNWLDDAGLPQYKNENIQLVDKGDRKEWRFHFKNQEDFCQQAVKIDGTGTIIIAGPTPGQSAKIIDLVYKHVSNVQDLTPEHVTNILKEALERFGLRDRYNDNLSTLDKKMRPVGEINNYLGPYVYDENKLPISAAIYLNGSGSFQGPALEPQNFENGGFIVFSGMDIKAAVRYIKSFDPHNVNGVSGSQAKLVSKSVFLRSRRDKHGHAINLDKINAQIEPVKNYKKIQPLGGFPELSPQFAIVQQDWIRKISDIYSSYGFTPIDTRDIEEIDTLLEQGEDSDKEIYRIERHSKKHDPSKDRLLALRFDLTVPTARYIAQNFSALQFPFRRQQIGKVHRADDPNQGRYREFYQADVDVVDKDRISIEYDAEMPRIMYDVTQSLGLGEVEIGINNRKIYQGFFREAGLEDDQIVGSIRILDKLAKIGPEGVTSRLSEEIGLAATIIDKSLELASIKEQDRAFADRVMAIGFDNDLIREGVGELSTVMRRLEDLPRGFAVADLSIARGLDYYSGTVFEGYIKDIAGSPAILAGGRYDNLVSRFMARPLPGVGISFGLTRVFNLMMEKKQITAGPATQTQVLVAHNGGDQDISDAMKMGNQLRARNIRTELFYGDLYNQMGYANRKGIPYVLFRKDGSAASYEIKDMRTFQQAPVDIMNWKP